ncbi:substrate-binding periplasmic protein [Desulfoluna spongiiphila]|uniref:Amino acid ABC transporter substrate-binding protein, PAAT family n=1 Tax=Desulfoluna spongiiphila TaxID=419481 RepID=A0A1G5BNV6_9BACT|nr:transporter substrate-binding domain-containing protein [Desulfoluna spongiiphila]SCX91747.1 amino acid ABC transporter substrate-binding protein, PAAT family [Desulfoluna spongiiphila]
MKKSLCIALLVLSCLSAWRTGTAETNVIVYCDDNYPPYSYAINGQPRGIYPAILTQAFARMEDYRVTILPIPWKRGLHDIENGTVFAICPPYFRPQERPFMWPYSVPILQEKVVLLCREDIMKDAPRRIWPDDFHGLTIGSNDGFILGGKTFFEEVRKNNIRIDEARSNRVNILKLGIRRTDCYINDRLAILWELNKLKQEGLYHEGTRHARLREALVINTEWGHLGYTNRDFGRFHFKEDFIATFNAVITAMQKNGDIERIMEQTIAAPE